MKILLVDNDIVYGNLLAEILTLYSQTVVRANDGQSALEMLRQEPVDLVISDALMPNMNGLELYQEVRADDQLKMIPFAYNTGHQDVLEILRIADPDLDFKFDKAGPLSAFLHFIITMDAAGRLKKNQGEPGKHIPGASAA